MSMRTSDVAAALRNHALSVMNVSGLSMNLRKPTSAAPYNAGWSATNGMDTLTCMSDAPKHLRFLEAGFERLVERTGPKSVHQPPSSTVSTSARFSAEPMAEASASMARSDGLHGPHCHRNARRPAACSRAWHRSDAASPLGHTGGLHQRAPAGVRLQGTRVRPHPHSGPSKAHRHVTDLTGETRGFPTTISPSRTIAPPMPISHDRYRKESAQSTPSRTHPHARRHIPESARWRPASPHCTGRNVIALA